MLMNMDARGMKPLVGTLLKMAILNVLCMLMNMDAREIRYDCEQYMSVKLHVKIWNVFGVCSVYA